MKKLLFSLSLVFSTLIGMNGLFAQAAVESGAKIEFKKETHDYGTIDQYADGTCEFTFTNTGNEPLIISNAKGSCGCTVPTWPKKPINPGESGEIEVKYATSRIGPINKSITITSNATESNKVLRIKGMVTKKETTPVKKENSMAPTAN